MFMTNESVRKRQCEEHGICHSLPEVLLCLSAITAVFTIFVAVIATVGTVITVITDGSLCLGSHCIPNLKECSQSLFGMSCVLLIIALVSLLMAVAMLLFLKEFESFARFFKSFAERIALFLSCWTCICLLLTVFCYPFGKGEEVVRAFIQILAGMSFFEMLLILIAALYENHNPWIWRSEKALEIGLRMIVYPSLFILLGVVAQKMQGMQDLVGEKGDLGKAMIALTILTYPVELWNVFLDVIKNDGKEAISRNSALETSLDGLRKEMQRTSETMGFLVESQQRMSQCMESMEKASGLAETTPGISCRRTESLYEIKMVLRRRKHNASH